MPVKDSDTEKIDYIISEPLHFDSVSDYQDCIEMINMGVSKNTKSEFKFVSYLETVMAEDDYDSRPNAILSDSFGSILNSQGEVFIQTTLMKVGKLGILIGDAAKREQIEELACRDDFLPLCYLSENPYFEETERSYQITGYPNIYIFDSFNMLSNKPEGDAYERSQTKAGSGVVWAQEAIKVGPRYDSEYVWPKEQKNKLFNLYYH